MGPPKQPNPHTPQEWKQIRSKFTDLYQVQKKKLSDVMKILGEQGFHASEHHYKTYIRKWGVDKKNKQSDMEFAIQKLRQRQGKDTTFLIRGEPRSRKDVEHYWRRKRCSPPASSTVPNTPNGVDYRTPSPCAERETGEAGSQEPLQEDADSAWFAWDEDIAAVFQYINRDWIVAPRSTILRLLESPEQLRPLDQALHYAKVLFQRQVECANADLRIDFLGCDAAVSRFMRTAENALAAIAYGLSHTVITAALLDTLESIPQVAASSIAIVTTSILRIISNYIGRTQSSRWTMRKMAVYEIVNRFGKVHGLAHPLPLILTAAIRSCEDTCTISQRVLMAGNDMLQQGSKVDELFNEDLLTTLGDICEISGDYNAALKHVIEAHRMTLDRHQTDMTQQSFMGVLKVQVQLSALYIQTGSLEKAERSIEDNLRACAEISDPRFRAKYRALFLYYRGIVLEMSGKRSAAVETFGKVIHLGLPWFGPGYHLVVAAAHRMKNLQQRQAEDAQRLSAAEEDHQNQDLADTRGAGQEEPGVDQHPHPLGDEGVLPFSPEAALPYDDGSSQLWTNPLEARPQTIGHVEEWTDEYQESYGGGLAPELELPVEEDQSWMDWTGEGPVEWTY
ncbi:hypothetical protein AYL99_08967 [Fonsecaea erecta]|uniref:Clr5 domain-containing protein n=1 Tax=Fonsecaea erecta TaxID=1367422 RepID=A0A178ZCP8_9EURO|nr:hypothetical protein AYL99_08967 [Fonsecaea erecta]OAP56855.1 hypothetical protein AYL99_08967 [Fonsecaea erecta]